MKLSFNSLFSKVGIDLGTTRVRIWTDQAGVVVDEPTAIAIETGTKRVVAVGRDAAMMQGRMGNQITVHFPVTEGLVNQVDETKVLLKVLLQRVFRGAYFFRPIMMVTVPTSADQVLRQALVEILYAVGARSAYTIAQPLAAAIGAGVPIADTSASFILHAGGGVVEAGVIALGSLVSSVHTNQAGYRLDEAIKQKIQDEEKILISLAQAEKLKYTLASITKKDAQELVTGQDMVTRAPREVGVSSKLVTSAIKPSVVEYVELLKTMIAGSPPELTADVIDKGLLLSGGLAQIPGLDRYMIAQLGVPVLVVEEPDKSVIKGVATALEHLDLFKDSLGYQQ